MELAYLVCVGGISFGTMGFFSTCMRALQVDLMNASGALPVHFWDALASRFSLSSSPLVDVVRRDRELRIPAVTSVNSEP